MRIEADSVNEFDSNSWSDGLYNQYESKKFSHQIFSNADHDLNFVKSARLNRNRSSGEQKTSSIFWMTNGKEQGLIAKKSVEGSAEVRGTVSWGGNDGPKGNISVTVEAHDREKNYVEVTVEQNSDGSGSASAAAGHETQDNSQTDSRDSH